MKSFEEVLDTTSAEWVRDGLITSPQREAILLRHRPAAAGSGRFVTVLATVGALLFAVGVSLVIKANWKELGDWTKIVGAVALMVGAYAAGWRLKASSYSRIGDALLMAGALLFLGGIALVSQTFHLNARPASYVLWWWLGIAAVPWLAQAKGAQFVSVVAGLTWLGMEMTTADSMLAVRSIGHRHANCEAVAVEAAFVLLGLGVWLAGMGMRRTRWESFAGLHEKWGILITCAALYLLGFVRHAWRSHGAYSGAMPDAWPAVGVAGVLAAAAAAIAWRRSPVETKRLAPWIALALVPVFGAIGIGSLGDDGWLWSAAAWLGLFTLSVAILRVGLETGREGWVNLGIACIALNILTRYFDLFGTMLEGGVFFIVTGVIVVGLGLYIEQSRRRLIARVRKELEP